MARENEKRVRAQYGIRPFRSTLFCVALLVSLIGFGTGAMASTTTTTPVSFVGQFSLQPSAGPAGTLVHAIGVGLPANQQLSVNWQQVIGSWVETQGTFQGRSFTPSLVPVASFTTGADGSFNTTFRVPSGYGFEHDVVLTQDATELNQAAFEVSMKASISPTSGPLGTAITIHAQGIGWLGLQNSWGVIYDNKFVGYLSAVTTQGTATATIPATGHVGWLYLRILSASATMPFLNMQQSPQPNRPTFAFAFRVTSGQPVLPTSVSAQTPKVVAAQNPSLSGAGGPAPAVWGNNAEGPVGTPLTLRGSGFLPGQTVTLNWLSQQGSNILGIGLTVTTNTIGTVQTAADGTFQKSLAVPLDLQGSHEIDATSGTSSASTVFVISPSAVPLTRDRGPVGTWFTIQLKGTGWSNTANIYTVDYDNAYVGYGCGVNAGGDITMHMQATGLPGWHFIDLYPAIYKGTDEADTNDFKLPQLTYAKDHPGENLPAFRFAFYVTK